MEQSQKSTAMREEEVLFSKEGKTEMGKKLRNNEQGDNDLNAPKENMSPDRKEDTALFNQENFIFTDNANIDTLKKEREDSEFSDMDKKEKNDTNKETNHTGRNGDKVDSVIEKILGLAAKISKKMKASSETYIRIPLSSMMYPVLFFVGTIIYLEIVLHLLNYRSIDLKIIYPILFAIPLGILLGFITGLFPSMINKILLWGSTGLICIIYITQLIYYYVFKVYFSFQTIGMAGDAISEFSSEVFTAIKANAGGILLLLVPLIILVLFLESRIDYFRRGFMEQAVLLGTSIVFHIVALVALLLFGKGDYTPFDLYHNNQVQNLCGKQLGIVTMTRIDIGKFWGGEDELVLADAVNLQPDTVYAPSVTPAPTSPAVKDIPAQNNSLPEPTMPPTPTPVDTSPNVMNIDFNALAKNEKNETIKTLHNYFATVTPTKKNEYTGMFKGYNLIMITAEGFSPYAVNKEKTPTLYKLVREGFVFNNFYTALWQTSTSDGEYAAMTGLIPTGSRNMYNGRNNLWPFSLGNQFNLLGVASKAYHNHTYTYYERNETHPNLGYIFKGKGNGLELEHPDVWPESDLEMMNATVDEYVDEDQFHVYYLTVSGHMNYTFAGNGMAYKNRDLVKDLPYSDDAKAYIACQIELDRALEALIAKLEQAGVADRTVIALSADHYPYGWEKSKLDELAGHTIDPNFEIYKNHFILWSEGMDENIVIDEPCSSLDILPTLSNLFGLEYDSRLLMGQDILSDAPPLVILSNRSFITDKVMYNSENGEVTKLTKDELPEDYINNINKIIKNKFTVSKSILADDYYRYVFKGDKE
jgi:lipoteichoic acid synthase